MSTVLKNIAAVLMGFVLASAIMMIIESINGKVLYPDLAKAAESIKDRESMRALFANAPIGALLVVIVGWFVGSATGCWLCRKITGSEAQLPRAVVVLGALLVIAGIANNLMIPPPLWFWIAGLIALAGGSYLGGRQNKPAIATSM